MPQNVDLVGLLSKILGKGNAPTAPSVSPEEEYNVKRKPLVDRATQLGVALLPKLLNPEDVKNLSEARPNWAMEELMGTRGGYLPEMPPGSPRAPEDYASAISKLAAVRGEDLFQSPEPYTSFPEAQELENITRQLRELSGTPLAKGLEASRQSADSREAAKKLPAIDKALAAVLEEKGRAQTPQFAAQSQPKVDAIWEQRNALGAKAGDTVVPQVADKEPSWAEIGPAKSAPVSVQNEPTAGIKSGKLDQAGETPGETPTPGSRVSALAETISTDTTPDRELKRLLDTAYPKQEQTQPGVMEYLATILGSFDPRQSPQSMMQIVDRLTGKDKQRESERGRSDLARQYQMMKLNRRMSDESSDKRMERDYAMRSALMAQKPQKESDPYKAVKGWMATDPQHLYMKERVKELEAQRSLIDPLTMQSPAGQKRAREIDDQIAAALSQLMKYRAGEQAQGLTDQGVQMTQGARK